MQRVLLVPLAWTPDDMTFGATARVLRDAGHEVVHGGAIGTPEQVAAVALQEDVDVVLLLGGDDADALADRVRQSVPDDLPVSVARPGTSREEVERAVAG